MIFLSALLWNKIFLPSVFVCGGLLTVGCRFLQFRRFKIVLKYTVGSIFKARNKNSNAPSPFQAASTALASTVGTGNIVGTAQAIAMGGPGAVFWLWVSALFGMIIKYAEIFLALKYRRQDSKGLYYGGPIYYILALGKGFAPLASAYALFALVSSLGMGNMVQINSGVSALCIALTQFCPLGAEVEFIFKLCFGLGLSILVYIILEGGAKSVGKASEVLVPIMSLAFILLSLIVIVSHIDALPSVLKSIIFSAFQPSSFGGAAVGITVREAIHWGIRRSAFSNEAGLGSSAMAHAAADTHSPALHSLWGIFEVFADTIVICSATAFVILCSGISIPWGSNVGPELFQSALSTTFSKVFSALFMSISMFSFAFATVIAWSLYGEQCAQFLFGENSRQIYRLIYCLCLVFGCIMSTSSIWLLADTANALMAIPNLIALFMHLPKICIWVAI